MKTRVGLVHATINAVPGITAALAAHAPDLVPIHFVDEGLLLDLPPEGTIDPARVDRLRAMVDRLRAMVAGAAASGARAVLVTCSCYSPSLSQLRPTMPVPVLGIDDPMLTEAVDRAKKSVGIVATVETAGPTTARLLGQVAQAAGKTLAIETRFVPGAFAALSAGDGARHDALVRGAIDDLSARHEMVILAQISMARALAGREVPSWPCPVLSSAASSVRALQAAARSSSP